MPRACAAQCGAYRPLNAGTKYTSPVSLTCDTRGSVCGVLVCACVCVGRSERDNVCVRVCMFVFCACEETDE